MVFGANMGSNKQYRLYIDESGDKSYVHMDIEPQKTYLCLCGVIIPYGAEYTILEQAMNDLKAAHFSDWHKQPVILTRSEIVNRRNAFSVLGADEGNAFRFDHDLYTFLAESQYQVISVVIDKSTHLDRYDAAWNPYNYCLWALMERYCGFLRHTDSVGDIVAESRGRADDMEIKEAYIEAYQSGTNLRPANFFQSFLTSKEIKIKKKIENISGLQVADMLAHPSKQDILLTCERIDDQRKGLPKAICDLLVNEKYLRRDDNGQIWSYGQYMIGGRS